MNKEERKEGGREEKKSKNRCNNGEKEKIKSFLFFKEGETLVMKKE